MMDEAARERVLRGLFDSFYRDEPAPTVFDTNRTWCARLPEPARSFRQSKVVRCVRDLAWVMDLLERQYRSNAFGNTGLFNNPAERSTVYTRTEALTAPGRLVGFAYQALHEACWGEGAERLALIDYDVLVARPAEVMGLIYDFVGEESFAHNFEAIEYDAPGFDAGFGMDGLHRVRPKVRRRSAAPSCRRTCSPSTRARPSGATSPTAPRTGSCRDRRRRRRTKGCKTTGWRRLHRSARRQWGRRARGDARYPAFTTVQIASPDGGRYWD